MATAIDIPDNEVDIEIPDEEVQVGKTAPPPDSLTQQTQAAAKVAGAPTGPAPQPKAAEMRKAGEAYKQSLGPQAKIEQLGTPQEKERLGSGLSMAAPLAVMTAGTTSPISTIAEEGVAGYLAPLARGAIKSYGGSEIGKRAGRWLGGMISPEAGKTGEQIGAIGGAIGGPLAPDSALAKVPFLGRALVGNEAYAEELAARKVAQRNADINAGLRKGPIISRESAVSKPPAPEVTGRPTESEQFATGLNKSSIWSPEDEKQAVRLWGDKARMRPGEGLVNYRARLQGYGYASRAARGMQDIENYPAPRLLE